MRSRGVEIYTPPTLAILKGFQTSREYNESVANAVLASASNTFVELIQYMPEAVNNGLLTYLDRQGFNATLDQPIGVFNQEIVRHTAAANGWIYDYAAQKRDVPVASIHFVDSLMFGVSLPMALASDAYLDKYHYRSYGAMPIKASAVDELSVIMRNESFAACVDAFTATGFGVIGDSQTTTKPGIDKDAGAGWRLREIFDLDREKTNLFFYNAEDDTFSLNPLAQQKLREVYQQQNRGEHEGFDRTQAIGVHRFNEPYLTAGCPERYLLKGHAVTGVEAAMELNANFFASVANYIRLQLPASPQLRKLAQLALQDHPQDEKLLFTNEQYRNEMNL